MLADDIRLDLPNETSRMAEPMITRTSTNGDAQLHRSEIRQLFDLCMLTSLSTMFIAAFGPSEGPVQMIVLGTAGCLGILAWGFTAVGDGARHLASCSFVSPAGRELLTETSRRSVRQLLFAVPPQYLARFLIGLLVPLWLWIDATVFDDSGLLHWTDRVLYPAQQSQAPRLILVQCCIVGGGLYGIGRLLIRGILPHRQPRVFVPILVRHRTWDALSASTRCRVLAFATHVCLGVLFWSLMARGVIPADLVWSKSGSFLIERYVMLCGFVQMCQFAAVLMIFMPLVDWIEWLACNEGEPHP